MLRSYEKNLYATWNKEVSYGYIYIFTNCFIRPD